MDPSKLILITAYKEAWEILAGGIEIETIIKALF